MTEAKHTPPTQAAIERAVALIDANIAYGDIDDEVAQVTTGGMIGDVADLFGTHDNLRETLRRIQGFASVCAEHNWRDCILHIERQVSTALDAEAEATKAT